MSKDRKKLLHIHSSVYDKQPTPESLELGELGVNNASGNTFISTKNSANEVVRFSEDDTIVNWMDAKEVFPYEGRVRGISGDSVSGLTEEDLLSNKSNIVLKINQVAAKDSVHDTDINGATDIYGNLVNPFDEETLTEGAGIAIDMSSYALVGGNPTFSSVTTTNKAIFNGETNVDGDSFNVTTDNVEIGDGSSAITYHRIGGNDACSSITSTTVDEALQEVFDKSVVSAVTATTTDPSKYDIDYVIYQDYDGCKFERGRIGVPKGAEVYGTVEHNDPCTSNTVNMSVVRDGVNKNYVISADTHLNIHVNGDDNNIISATPNCGLELSAYTLSAVSGSNVVEYNPFVSGSSINIPTSVCDLESGTLTIVRNSGDSATSAVCGTYDPCEDKTINIDIPEVEQCNASINFVYGNACNDGEDSGYTYTPCGESGKTVVIPKNMGDIPHNVLNIVNESGNKLAEYNPGSACTSGITEISAYTLSAVSGTSVIEYNPFAEGKRIDLPTNIYQLKYVSSALTHNGKTINVLVEENAINDSAFTHEALTINYGDVRGITESGVTYDTSESRSVTIPTSVSGISHGNLTIVRNSGDSATSAVCGTYDPCEDKTINIDIPEVPTPSELVIEHNGLSAITYAPESGVGSFSHAVLTIEYGATSGKSGSVEYDTSGALSATIPTKVTHLENDLESITFSTGKTSISGSPYNGSESAEVVIPSDAKDITWTDTPNACFEVNNVSDGLNAVYEKNRVHLSRTTTSGTGEDSGTTYTKYTFYQDWDCEEKYEIGSFTISDGGTPVPPEPGLGSFCVDYVSVSGKTRYCIEPDTEDKTVYVPNSVGHLNRGILEFKHNGETVTYDPAEPSSGHELPHSALTVNYGGNVSGISESSVTYDTSSGRTITIPTHLSGITHGLLTFSGAVDGTYDLASGATVTIPNVELKKLTIDHNGEFEYDPEVGSAMNLSHSNLIVNYGGNVSGISESSVTYNTSSDRTITIPTHLSGITHGDLTINYDGKKHMSYMSTPIIYDPSESGKTIDVPIKVEQLIRGKFTIMVNSGQSNSASTIYDPSGNTEFNIDIPEPYDSDLTIIYGADVKNRYGNDVYTPSTSGTVSIPTSVNGINHGNLTINVNGVSAGTYDPGIESAQTIDIDVPKSYNEKLTIAYGNSGKTIGSYNPASGETITIPSGKTLTIKYGGSVSNSSTTEYYNSFSAQTITIPTAVQDITNGAITYDNSEQDGCISISKDICMEGHTIVATSFYSTSDRNLKENIQSLLSMDAEKAAEVHFKTFNFKDDETKTKTYGVIAQEVEGCGLNEIVHKDDNGNLSVDYISLLILKIANLENKVDELQSKVSELEKNNKQEGNN